MNEKKVLREVMDVKRMSQQQLADKAGYRSQGHIGNILARPSMRVDVLVRLLNAMDCELVVRSKSPIELPGTKGDAYIPEWVIDESASGVNESERAEELTEDI